MKEFTPYIIAEDELHISRGNNEAEAVENFRASFGCYPCRLIEVYAEDEGMIDGQVIWEKEE